MSQKDEPVLEGTVKLPDGLIVPERMILDLKAVHPRGTLDGDPDSWIAPIERDQTYIGKGQTACSNCGGPEGEGRLFAPTGEERERGPYWLGGHHLIRKMVSYPCPICRSKIGISRLIAKSGIKEFANLDLTAINLPGRETLLEPLMQTIERWTSGGPPNGWINFIGPINSGKTWAAMRLGHDLIMSGWEARYCLAADLSDLAYEAIRQGDDPMSLLMSYRYAPVLIVDELFLIKQVNASGEMQFGLDPLIRMLNDRYRLKDQLATVMVWDIDWWMIDPENDLYEPNLTLAGNLAPILSRSAEADVFAWTRIGGMRELIGAKKRGIR